jgi:hypothetical protein
MAGYRSPLGNKEIKGTPMKDYSVPDESSGQPAQFAPPQQQRRPNREEYPPFNPEDIRKFNEQLNPQPQHPQGNQISETEMNMMAAKKAQREGKQRLSDGARRRIEMLIGMVRLSREIDIEGNVFKLQTLKSKELRDALVATAEFDGTIQQIFETRKQLLARSLVMIAGVDVEQFLNSDEMQDRLDFIEEMDHSLLLRLYSEYISLAKEAQDKYALKTPEEVKEVLEDLKK